MAKFLLDRGRYVLVIEISKANLKIASFLHSHSRLELLDYVLERLGPDESSKAKIVNSIRVFLKKNSLSVNEAILSIADPDAVSIKDCLLPALKHSEIQSAAIWQLKDEVNFDLKGAYSQWRVVKEFTDEQGARQQRIIFAFSRKEVVEDYLACLSECNLSASAVVTSALNYAEILKDIKDDKTVGSEIVLDLDYLDSTLNLYIDKKLYFTRYLPVSVENLTRSLIGTLISERGKVELDLSQAVKIRDEVGIPDEQAILLQGKLQASQIFSLIRPVLESLVRETKHSISYFTSQLKELKPQVIYISGFGANLKNLDTYLAKELESSVFKLPFADILDSRRIQPDSLERDRSQLVSCVGAVLLASRGISLFAGDVRMRWVKNALIKRLRPFISVLGVLILSFMFISVLMIPVLNYRLKKSKSYFNDKKLLFSFFEKVPHWKQLNNEILMQRFTADALLNFISQSVPNDLCLSGLELNQYRGELILQGEAKQGQSLDTFFSKLKASDYFSNLKISNYSGGAFRIKCNLKY